MAWIVMPNEDGTKSLVHSDLCDDYLAHHGIKGQKWGVIRFRNKAGTKRHKKTSLKKSKKSGKQRKVNSKLANRSKDRRKLNRRLQQELQRIQMQMIRDQIWQQQQQINSYNSMPMFF